MDEFDEALKNYLIDQAAAVLKCDDDVIRWEDDIDEYGFESLQVNQFCLDINRKFSININPSLFLEVTSLKALSRHLKKDHFQNVESCLL